MIKSWSDDAWDDFCYWQKQDKKTKPKNNPVQNSNNVTQPRKEPVKKANSRPKVNKDIKPTKNLKLTTGFYTGYISFDSTEKFFLRGFLFLFFLLLLFLFESG